jgi:hypothetical protein
MSRKSARFWSARRGQLSKIEKGQIAPTLEVLSRAPECLPGGAAQRKLGKLKTAKTKPRSSLFSWQPIGSGVRGYETSRAWEYALLPAASLMFTICYCVYIVV